MSAVLMMMATAPLFFAAIALPIAVQSSAGGHCSPLFLNGTESQAVFITDGWNPFAAPGEGAATGFEMPAQFQPPDVCGQPQSADMDGPQPELEAPDRPDAPSDSSGLGCLQCHETAHLLWQKEHSQMPLSTHPHTCHLT